MLSLKKVLARNGELIEGAEFRYETYISPGYPICCCCTATTITRRNSYRYVAAPLFFPSFYFFRFFFFFVLWTVAVIIISIRDIKIDFVVRLGGD